MMNDSEMMNDESGVMKKAASHSGAGGFSRHSSFIIHHFRIIHHFCYSLLLTLAAVLLSPLLLLRWRKYAPGLRQRLGFVPELATNRRRVLWLHCVSVGETQAARPLVDALLKAYPDYLLVVSTITVTGQRLAQEVFSQQAAAVFYFPADWAFIVRRVLQRIKPSAVLIMETELWPNFLRVCQAEGVPTVLVNGRLSARSARGYQRVRWFIAPVINNLTLALMQDRKSIGACTHSTILSTLRRLNLSASLQTGPATC